MWNSDDTWFRRLSGAVAFTGWSTGYATPLMAAYLQDKFDDPVLMGPDSEAEQWVGAVAKPNRREYGVC